MRPKCAEAFAAIVEQQKVSDPDANFIEVGLALGYAEDELKEDFPQLFADDEDFGDDDQDDDDDEEADDAE